MIFIELSLMSFADLGLNLLGQWVGFCSAAAWKQVYNGTNK